MRLLLTILAAFVITGCGGGGGNSDAGDTVYYVNIKDSTLNTVSLSGENFANLLAAPVSTGSKNGGGSVDLKLGYGDWISEFTDLLHSDTAIPSIVVVAGKMTDEGNIIETSRTEYQNAFLTGEVLHGSDSEEYVNYTFSFEQYGRTDHEVVHDVGGGLLQSGSQGSLAITRYLNFGSPNAAAGELYAGHTKFPAVADQSYIETRYKPNTLIQVLSYTISLYRSATESPGFKVELVDDPVFLNLLDASNQGTVFSAVSIYEIDTGRPARLRKVYVLQDTVIENPMIQSGTAATGGQETLSANLTPTQFNSISLQYDGAGRYKTYSSLCTNIENGPQRCS